MHRLLPTALMALATVIGTFAVTSPGGSVPVDPDWWSGARAEIERSEYQVSRTARGLQAPNRAQNLRTYFREGAIEILPRTDVEGAAWRAGWRTVSWGRADHMLEARVGAPQAHGARVTYPGAHVSEWYENRHGGLEQGFTVHRRAPGDGPLRVEGRVEGTLRASLRADGSVDLVDANDVRVLNYGDLHVWDADDGELTSWLEVDGNAISIVVDDRASRYPLTIDPILTSPDWTGQGGQANALFGSRLATAGDVNGDGYSDVIVGAYGYDGFGEVDKGRVYVYLGSASGLATSHAWFFDDGTGGSRMGTGVASAGDVNGDGYDDVIVGASGFANGRGRAYVFHGSASGLDASPAWTTTGGSGANLGWDVDGAGDVNGDGYDDVIVGALLYDFGGTDVGNARVFHGSASGLGPVPSWNVYGDDPGGQFGCSVGTAGDVNGDGYDDVIVGAYVYDNGHTDEGRAFVYHGGPDGLSTTFDWLREGNEDGAWFGFSVSTAGDVNGDGYADVLVGAPHKDGGNIVDSGEAYLYHGSFSGLSTTPAWIAGTSRVGAEEGFSVATAGDVNGDGFADVVVAAPEWYSAFGQVEGLILLRLGSPLGLQESSITIGTQNGGRFGHCVATAGDVNGDGLSDLLVGSQLHDGAFSNSGQAVLYLGETESISDSPEWTEQGDSIDYVDYGNSVSSAGDVNGDGFSDVIVGAPTYDNGESNEGKVFVYHGASYGLPSEASWTAEGNQPSARLGTSVASAGDVNGDGYDDVIVGAIGYTDTIPSEGGAFVYLGSAGGLAASAAWITGGGQEGSYHGWSVASAGDVDGDGFADVIVGAPYFQDTAMQEGRATTYLGSESGLATTPSWSVVSGQSAAFLGVSVASAGDVNGDGYSDVIVGVPFFDNGETDEGVAYVYHGSESGLSSAPDWTAELDTPLVQLGYSVATAGDVNGDGYSDVIVGAPFTSSMTSNAGAALAFFGSAAGLGDLSWSNVFDQEEAQYGWSVSTAGDVNGDGYSDFIVGAPSERAAFLYLGAPELVPTTPAATITSQTLNLRVGWSVASAGDVNGDGFADVLVGGGEIAGGVSRGAAFMYFGSARRGISHTARQSRVGGEAPIARLGRSDRQYGFRVEARARSAAGRSRVRLEVEAKPLGVPFDGNGTVITLPTDSGLSGVTLEHLLTSLQADTAYRWRTRVLDDSPLFPPARWLSIPGNGLTETDVRTGVATTATPGDAPAAVPPVLAFSAPSPNPSSGTVALRVALPAAGVVRIGIYDVAGRRVAVAADGRFSAGAHAIPWDGRNVTGRRVGEGTYFARLRFGGRTEVRKILRVYR